MVLAVAKPPDPGTQHNLDAEMSVLGAAFLRPLEVMPALSLKPEDFYDPRCGVIWRVMLWLHGAAKPIDLLTVEDELRRDGKLAAVGGLGFLADLTGLVPTADNVGSYAAIVRRDAQIRRIHAKLSEILYLQNQEPEELLDLIHGMLRTFDAQRQLPARSAITASEAAMEDFGTPLPAPMPTGYANVDGVIGGLRASSFYILSGPTGRGKTGLALDIAMSMARTRPVVYLSEFDRRQAVARMAAKVARTSWLSLYEQGPSEKEILRDYLLPFSIHPVEIGDKTNLLDELARVADVVGQQPILVLDYLQCLMRMKGGAGPDGKFREATSGVSQMIRQWARDMRSAALVVSSVARQFYNNNAGRTAADFTAAAKESGDIDYDAAALFFLDTDPCPRDGTSQARLHISKHRFGVQEQTVCMTFHGASGRFEPDEGTAYVIDEERMILRAVQAGEQEPLVISKLLKIPGARMGPIWSGLMARGLLARREDGVTIVTVSV